MLHSYEAIVTGNTTKYTVSLLQSPCKSAIKNMHISKRNLLSMKKYLAFFFCTVLQVNYNQVFKHKRQLTR